MPEYPETSTNCGWPPATTRSKHASRVSTPATLQLASQAQHIAHLLGFSINHVLTGGASDASYASHYGVPALDGLGPMGGLDHSPSEYLLANSVAPRAALLAGLIATIGAKEEV